MTKIKIINYSRRFDKDLRKAPLKIKIAFKKRREIFSQDPFHPQLNNHGLTGGLRNYRSINITGDWRAIYSEHGGIIIFEAVGTHSQIYK